VIVETSIGSLISLQRVNNNISLSWAQSIARQKRSVLSQIVDFVFNDTVFLHDFFKSMLQIIIRIDNSRLFILNLPYVFFNVINFVNNIILIFFVALESFVLSGNNLLNLHSESINLILVLSRHIVCFYRSKSIWLHWGHAVWWVLT